MMLIHNASAVSALSGTILGGGNHIHLLFSFCFFYRKINFGHNHSNGVWYLIKPRKYLM